MKYIIATLAIVLISLGVTTTPPAMAQDGCIYGRTTVTRAWRNNQALTVCAKATATLDGGRAVTLTVYDDTINFRTIGQRKSTTRLVMCENDVTPTITQNGRRVHISCKESTYHARSGTMAVANNERLMQHEFENIHGRG